MPGANALTGRTDGPLLQKPSPQCRAIRVSERQGIGPSTPIHRLRVKQNSTFLLVFHREVNTAGLSCFKTSFRRSPILKPKFQQGLRAFPLVHDSTLETARR